MSYLDFPRLHFSGLFYTGPSTVNNITQNYTESVDIEAPPPAPPNQFNMGDTGTPGEAGWNPMGGAQWWLEECTVLSAVGPDGAGVGASDPVLGALVQSPSPKTPISDGQGGFYDIAKMVDLDPDQQGRSAVFGLRISVTLPNGAGLQGLMTVPELRQLNKRIAVPLGSWAFVGNWMGTLQDVQWSGDISGSPLLTALQAGSAQGLAVKLTVDLHQNNPANVFTSGDMFCYGRVLGSIGPVFPGELSQVVPGRCLQTFVPPATKAARATAVSGKRVLQGRERVVAEITALSQARAALKTEAAAAPPPPDPWLPAFAVMRQAGLQTVLSLDIGGSILLNHSSSSTDPAGFVSDGTFEVDSGIVIGLYNPSDPSQFAPFTNGAITISPQYQLLQSTPKNCNLVKNSAVFTIPLTLSEATGATKNPLAIQVNGTTVAAEDPDGWWMDVSVSSHRLECSSGQTSQAQIMVRKFGQPYAGQQPPITVSVQLFQWILVNGQWTNPSNLPISTDVGLNTVQTDANGLADMTINVNALDITLPAVRQPLDSQIYLIMLTDPEDNVIGDISNAPLSVLLWKAYAIPANPTWANDVGPIFSAYARLYPGMKARLDLSDEATVVGFATGILNEHMALPMTDPAYMPVTRDLSPSKMAMIINWLTGVVAQQQSAAGSQPEKKL